MQRITMMELREKYGGVLPLGFALRADDGGEPTARPAAASPARAAAAPGRVRETKGSRKPNPVVRRLFGYRRFFARLPSLEPRLTPGAIAIWAWLWTSADRRGRVRTSERRLAERLGMARGTVRRRLIELVEAGFVALVRRGKHGCSATIYRIRATPKRVKD